MTNEEIGKDILSYIRDKVRDLDEENELVVYSFIMSELDYWIDDLDVEEEDEDDDDDDDDEDEDDDEDDYDELFDDEED